jgi:hypothetical protein
LSLTIPIHHLLSYTHAKNVEPGDMSSNTNLSLVSTQL